ncbi:EAL domain-containing protein [Stella sp.]|uniref:EAL domain-containing protein n=1 Tax=Stella sp. TaxID=2912054 RepID=UPI0035B0FAF5
MTDSATPCAACRDPQPLFPFTMAFQPIVDVDEARIVGHEALVRGPAGEGAGAVLGQLTAENIYTFDQACRVKAIELAARLGLDGDLGINFLPNAVYEPRACIRRTLDAAARTGFPLHRLTFEFVENEHVADAAHTLRIIEEYKRQGFKVALDDFGTGYSNLWQIAELKPDILKIDRRLVANCDGNPRMVSVLRGVVGMAEETGTRLVAEGVERIEEVRTLRAVGIRLMQGYHFAKPRFEGVVGRHEIAWPAAA